ncbi:energy-coupling factor transporter transmembrane component T family protein [Streptococcus ruminantium]|uniref:Energy-coupling factor transporter transmembrane protein EcfT n=1 Tax=Streptococcus ruminantium TaxID=1917441 RepID=A0ABU1B6A3_9STRE|nr:energy-coupling factor transporter transmembrane protein EcfT [Streptococcus ruminantium]MDQ8760250.1 energy-coupling factor transporter transmembrane protein EcfT [Streptococcus ruminantium]MDQ8765345.1 energy-coupling factor transporter transmembrane protein EcfT [Streptococcus ruminantium]MDQ8769847.1 energy-coupling factor transporter transmembrane protein EcfT [Streptococcus ruminantium]MDQ8775609.1 energy-coupling factor transporter transmembrane protein EcfT [Streptococcus ruminantium
MDKLILGRYIPGNSIIHRLDPRSKLLAMFSFLLMVFWANNLVTNALLFAFVFAMVLLSRIRLSFFINGLKPMIGIILFTTFFQVFFTSGTTILWEFWIFKVTVEGLQQAGIIFARFVLIIFFSTLLTLTTTPLSLADGIESGLAPLRYFKVPVHEIGLMLSMSLRFVPTLMDDTTRIMNAQRARGVDFNEGNIIQKVKSVIPILIPLFASSFKRADALATAMEARGYQGGDGRTKYRVLDWKLPDSLTILVMLILAGILYLLKN